MLKLTVRYTCGEQRNFTAKGQVHLPFAGKANRAVDAAYETRCRQCDAAAKSVSVR